MVSVPQRRVNANLEGFLIEVVRGAVYREVDVAIDPLESSHDYAIVPEKGGRFRQELIRTSAVDRGGPVIGHDPICSPALLSHEFVKDPL